MTLRDRAATALDHSLDAAAARRGIHTDAMRDYVAAWLDGVKVPIKIVRKAVRYLEVLR